MDSRPNDLVFKIPAEGLPSFTDSNNVTTGQGRISQRLFHANQSWCYEAIWALCGRKIRIMVTRNAYDNQSFCKAQAYDEAALEWKFLCDVNFDSNRHCFKVTYVQPSADIWLFEQDADDVLEKACRILNPFYAQVAAAEEGEAKSRPSQAPYVTKVELITRIYFSDGAVIDRPVDRT